MFKFDLKLVSCCFSAEASFLAAAVTGVAGVVAISRTTRRSEWPLAAMPLFFAIQQLIEGFLWQTLPAVPGEPEAALWTELFLLFALVFWPIYAPVSVWLVEPERPRRQWMMVSVVAGIISSAYFMWSLSLAPQFATVDSSHIVYSGDPAGEAGAALSEALASLVIVFQFEYARHAHKAETH